MNISIETPTTQFETFSIRIMEEERVSKSCKYFWRYFAAIVCIFLFLLIAYAIHSTVNLKEYTPPSTITISTTTTTAASQPAKTETSSTTPSPAATMGTRTTTEAITSTTFDPDGIHNRIDDGKK